MVPVGDMSALIEMMWLDEQAYMEKNYKYKIF